MWQRNEMAALQHGNAITHVTLLLPQHNFAADGLREALGFDSHVEAMTRLPAFMSAFWSLCPSLACGFKVFPGQVSVRPDRIARS